MNIFVVIRPRLDGDSEAVDCIRASTSKENNYMVLGFQSMKYYRVTLIICSGEYKLVTRQAGEYRFALASIK